MSLKEWSWWFWCGWDVCNSGWWWGCVLCCWLLMVWIIRWLFVGWWFFKLRWCDGEVDIRWGDWLVLVGIGWGGVVRWWRWCLFWWGLRWCGVCWKRCFFGLFSGVVVRWCGFVVWVLLVCVRFGKCMVWSFIWWEVLSFLMINVLWRSWKILWGCIWMCLNMFWFLVVMRKVRFRCWIVCSLGCFCGKVGWWFRFMIINVMVWLCCL